MSHTSTSWAQVRRGPGTAVRAPAGTKYRVYGLVVVNGGADDRDTGRRRTIYMSSDPSDGGGHTAVGAEAVDEWAETSPKSVDFAATKVAAPTSSGDSGALDAHCSVNVREYEQLAKMVLSMPLGVSVDERSTVRAYAWGNRVARDVRPLVWRLLCNCVPSTPASHSRQEAELRRKRQEYQNFVSKYYKMTIADFLRWHSPERHTGKYWENRSVFRSPRGPRVSCGSVTSEMVSPDDGAILTQIALDLPRHTQAIFHHPKTAAALVRCLFLWSRRYPAVGYVQGIDDIMVVFLFVFLEEAINQFNLSHSRGESLERSGASEETEASISEPDSRNTSVRRSCISPQVVYCNDVNEMDVALACLPVEMLQAAEADAYLCGGFFLSWLQDNFVQGQPGIRRTVNLMERVIAVVDPELLQAITFHGIGLMDCCFQWFHCLLARELSVDRLLVLWEKYMALGNSEMVLDFHAYVCAELLRGVRDSVIGKPVDEILKCLKDPLGVRSGHSFQGSPGESVSNRHWLDELIGRSSQLFRDYPPSSIT
ncbi:Rab GTPase TBC domain [Trypanosoma vivax]|uniref:Rab-GAP TBC domain-containing protein n=1 Tax=Trypanosoma vivax (strain Y486) TaxID=1055687 RepID=G0TRZ7_TRYVY|nr:hypothetical protein TRVL_07064 [Trypanosoma vivax]KAH8617345.1 Rab GTPase TBC domain [Trypanosoma vivax]CCC46721.1 conserved hypothetical protein [Trypanosoma vivax Y486]